MTYHTILNCIMSCYSILLYSVLYYTALYCCSLYYTSLCDPILYCFILYLYTMLYCTTLYRSAQFVCSEMVLPPPPHVSPIRKVRGVATHIHFSFLRRDGHLLHLSPILTYREWLSPSTSLFDIWMATSSFHCLALRCTVFYYFLQYHT